MELFGLKKLFNCQVLNLKIENDNIKIGDDLIFSFDLLNKEKTELTLRVEYGIYYIKSSGKQSRKLFKITENKYIPNQTYHFKRKQSFKDLTTRKHFTGKHKLSIVINGNEFPATYFHVSR